MTDPVRDQYEVYPYPARDPRDEAKRLIETTQSHLDEINHYVYAGRRDFSRPFRVLVAGGGTGDVTVMLAQRLADRSCPGEIVHLDLSAASTRIAEARVAVRGLGNARFVVGSLTELAALGLGRFDYIDCVGVLHHLDDPPAALRGLADALVGDGGMALMVYGALGRTGVYQMQAMLRRLTPPADPPATRVEVARRLLKQLPPTNWFARNPVVVDHIRGGDAGLYDLLLHGRDRPYTVPDLVELVTGAGLEICSFIEPWRYDPARYVSDGAILKRLAGLGRFERAAFAELLAGNLKRHVCYVVKAGRAGQAVARPDDPAAVPILHRCSAAKLLELIKPGPVLALRVDGIDARFALPPRAVPILTRVDGRRNLTELHRAVSAAESGRLDWPTFKAEFDRLYAVLNDTNRMLLTYPTLP